MKSMDRKQFMTLVGTSIGAIVLQHCLSGCKNEKDEAVNPGSGSGGGSTGLSLDLSNTAYSALNANGGYVYVSGIIVARTSAGAYIAVSQACTHQGVSVQYRSANNDFYCSAHGSRFSTTGTVLAGPASSALKQYKTELTGTTLRVFE
ncbi:ubiquinol-cytochrome c reductase iron-sulfur subunit [Siphonobacter sp. SORGH_AS_0500]|uniref:ubiquinol-cytochrome c reductase iron-sulfur subunit n=1 Tax=Siphonobacter sp. SORGH_AS_0500 TaxID=1864824 RepID=UPI0018E352B2|nr:Rieske 2Fe-2S domain-containing protein [Siphonobacter sp. SORGH_AS_0500]